MSLFLLVVALLAIANAQEPTPTPSGSPAGSSPAPSSVAPSTTPASSTSNAPAATKPAAGSGNGTALSGCELCRDKRDCSKANRGSPGQYCYDWLDQGSAAKRHACCCPAEAVCRVATTNYECKCDHKKTSKPKKSASSSVVVVSTTGVAIASLIAATNL
ncbi:TPA: hypothetical protein N0F65_000642 [Lagenidium giganteum]|uniref:Uncharacterized protein n=1 Tax=Lagenidium giganteum TaxID=4803 RepID=A0AAV2YS86_9STRA|nr:TPA: hypothetical protein N0F65_000642 [Lagenidium giganteum]